MTTKRSKAPNVSVLQGRMTQRSALLEVLSKENPAHYYSYEKSDVTDWELEAKGAEVVKGEDGKPLHHMGDLVTRRDKKEHDALQKELSELSAESVQTSVREGSVDSRSSYRNPKTPTKDKRK